MKSTFSSTFHSRDPRKWWFITLTSCSFSNADVNSLSCSSARTISSLLSGLPRRCSWRSWQPRAKVQFLSARFSSSLNNSGYTLGLPGRTSSWPSSLSEIALSLQMRNSDAFARFVSGPQTTEDGAFSLSSYLDGDGALFRKVSVGCI